MNHPAGKGLTVSDLSRRRFRGAGACYEPKQKRYRLILND